MNTTPLDDKILLLYKGGLSGRDGEPISKECKSLILNTNDKHLFCGKNNFSNRVSTFALTCLSYTNDLEGNNIIKEKISESIASCESCLLDHYNGRCELYYYLSNTLKMSYIKVEHFFKELDIWRAESLMKLEDLNAFALKTKNETDQVLLLSSSDEEDIQIIDSTGGSDSLEGTDNLNKSQQIFMNEVLLNPMLLEVNSSCSNIFKEIIAAHSQSVQNMSIIKQNLILPAIISDYFSSTENNSWSSDIMKSIIEKETIITAEECNVLSLIVLELVNQSIKFEKQVMSKDNYYLKIAGVLQIMNEDSLKEFFSLNQLTSINKAYPNYKPFLIKLILDLSEKPNATPLYLLFRIMKIIFQKLGKSIWSLFLKDFKVEHFVIVLRAPESKLVLKQQIIHSQGRLNCDLFDSQPHLSDFIEWVNYFYYSLNASLDMLFFSRTYVNFVLKFVDENHQLQSIPKGLLTCSGCIYLNKLLAVDEGDEKQEISGTITYLEDKLNEVIPYRGVMNKESFLQTLVNYSLKCSSTIKSDNTVIIEKISEPIFNLLFTCLQIDLNILILSISKLQNDQKALRIEDIKPISSLVYDYIIRNLSFYSFNEAQKVIFTQKFFNHLRNVFLVINLSNYTSFIKEKSDKINQNVSLIMGKIIGITSKIEADDYSFFSKSLLNNQDVLYGFWSCIFSDNRMLYSKAVGLLYYCFDQEDRISNFNKLLSLDLKNNLIIVTNILNNLCDKKIFEPCYFAISVLQDFIDAMVVLIKTDFNKEHKLFTENDIQDSLFEFWKTFWKFIKTLYETAYKWAHILKLEVLLEFCKNSMDLHKLATESVVWFDRVLKEKSKYDLISSILDVLIICPTWLKLNDEPLVDQCINLLIYILEMANNNWNRTVAKVIIYEIFSIANQKDPETGKIKKSLTTSEQRKRLIDVLYDIDSEYVAKLSKKLTKFSSFDPNIREDADVKIISSSKSAYPIRDDSISYALKGSKLSFSNMPNNLKKSTLPSLSLKALGSTKVKSTIMSSKDRAEEQLRLARASNGRVIHPASNNVFNDSSKKKQLQSSSSDDDEDDDDVAEIKEMFGLTKANAKVPKQKKKQGITLVDEFGNEIVKPNNNVNSRKKVSLEDLQKIERSKMEKRLKVDINPFYKEILKWNFRNNSDYPYENFTFSNTKLKYENFQKYQETMGPLLLLETWQQIVRSRQLESQKVIAIDITNRISVGGFFMVFATVPSSLWEKCKITESDLCGIGCNKGSGNVSMAPHTSKQFTTLDVVNYAKIDQIKNTRGDLKEISIKISLDSEISSFVSPGTFLYLTKISSVITSEREYTSLYGLQDYNMLDKLISSTISPPIKLGSSEMAKTVAKYNVNQSQAEAIIGATNCEGISLVQGPPGTGKSKTIVSMMKYYFQESKINFEEMPTNKKRVLLCAPSNAAIDELLIRLSIDTELKLVRIGRKEIVNSKVQHLVLNELIESKLKKPELISIDHNKYQEEMKRRNDIKDQIELNKSKAETPETMKILDQLRVELTMCNDTLNVMRKERDSVRETNNVFRRRSEFEKKNLTQKIISEVDIVCCTLSGAAQNQLQSLGIFFPTVVVDEACQCTELSALVPLRYGAKQIIMVGDPNQLPPTVISSVASAANYDESLFARLIQGNKPYLLNVQYRMHPEISKFPSTQFYESQLKDGPNMDKLNEKQWHKDSLFQPYKFFNLSDGKEEKSQSLSLSNPKEAEFALELVDTLLKRFPRINFKNQIGIVSPYKEQVRLIKRLFEMRFGSLINQTVAIETVDSFQGQEKTIMIFSCVRSSDTSNSIGFLRDFRRLNVALTRGKSNMWIIGNSNMLRNNKLWNNLINDAKNRNVFVQASYKLFENKSNVADMYDEDEDDTYSVKSLKRGNSLITTNKSLSDNEKVKKVKISNFLEEKPLNKTSLANVSSKDNDKIKPNQIKKVSLDNQKKSIVKRTSLNSEVNGENKDNSETSKAAILAVPNHLPGVYIHDAAFSQTPLVETSILEPKELKSILRDGNSNKDTKKKKNVSFVEQPNIKIYRKRDYEDESFGPIDTTTDNLPDDMSMNLGNQTHFNSVNIDGTSKQIKSVKKSVLDINKYKKSKAKQLVDDEDEYELPPSKKQKVNDIDDDAYNPISTINQPKKHPKVSVIPKNNHLVVEEEDDDDYNVLKSDQVLLKNGKTNNISKPQIAVNKKSKKKLQSSPFIKDPYKLLKLQKKKSKNNK